MKPNELFNLIKETDFVTVGDKVDFTVRTFPKEKRIHCFVKLFPDSVEE